MIKYIDHDGIKRPVIMMDELIVNGDIREFRSALLDVLSTCLLNEELKESTKSLSLWYLVRLIDETTIEEKGGVCNG